ncbi:Hpt domain-containing protein [Clostridium sp. C2-6-12]|uniref:Hpt domain-containing protein n=1 Tax=Clostridium sp. C2-6-12 TaxID=2698832 RepID=UPI0013689575|nr:Hpt domain-containing protein [Clostridium sp. C2-6-12]
MDYNNKYDIVGFAHDLGLSIEDVSELYAELVHELNLALLELKILMIDRDIKKIQNIVHNIKGVSGNYRLTDLYEETSKINDALKNSDYPDFEKDLNHLFNVTYGSIKEITNFFKRKSISI